MKVQATSVSSGHAVASLISHSYWGWTSSKMAVAPSRYNLGRILVSILCVVWLSVSRIMTRSKKKKKFAIDDRIYIAPRWPFRVTVPLALMSTWGGTLFPCFHCICFPPCSGCHLSLCPYNIEITPRPFMQHWLSVLSRVDHGYRLEMKPHVLQGMLSEDISYSILDSVWLGLLALCLWSCAIQRCLYWVQELQVKYKVQMNTFMT